MKKISYIVIPVLAIIIAVVLLMITSKSENCFIVKLAEIARIRSKNLLVNSDFKSKEKWNYDKNISFIETNNTTIVYIDGENNRQNRIWQNINVVSGKLYRLSFSLKGPGNGAFAIYREPKTGREKYLWCNDKNENKKYTWEIVPNISGNNQIYLSTNKEGKYYYSNISVREINKTISQILLLLTIILLTIPLLFLLRYKLIFTLIVLTSIIIPIIHINSIQSSKKENRNLAKYKKLFSRNGNSSNIVINLNYGIDLNSWLNDHFFLRNRLISLYNQTIIKINNRIENSFVAQGKNGFFFKKSNIEDIISLKNLSEDEYKATVDSIKKFNVFCQKNNIDLYILVIPFCAEIYDDNLIGIKLNNLTKNANEIVKRIKSDTDINILCAYDVLKEKKGDKLLYYKTDHHWSQLGAFYGYNVVIDSISNKYTDIIKVREEQYKIRSMPLNNDSLLNQLNYHDNNNNAYVVYEYKQKNDISGVWRNQEEDLSHAIIKNQNGYTKRVFLFGDSFILNYYHFFTHTFKETFCYYKCLQMYMPYFENIISDYKPDIVILNIYEENFKFIKYWYGKKE